MTENGIENFTVAPRTIAVGVEILFFSPRSWDVSGLASEKHQMTYDKTIQDYTTDNKTAER